MRFQIVGSERRRPQEFLQSLSRRAEITNTRLSSIIIFQWARTEIPWFQCFYQRKVGDSASGCRWWWIRIKRQDVTLFYSRNRCMNFAYFIHLPVLAPLFIPLTHPSLTNIRARGQIEVAKQELWNHVFWL
jgi:hypothetical protein